jgi:hypothetical protein
MAEESKEEKEKRSLSEKWAIGITISGGVIFIIALVWYLASTYFKWGNKLDPTLAAQAGDFIGGIVGSLWALAGVVLVYSALQAQRRDFKTNLVSLNNQIKEYKEHKEVLEEQSETLKNQRFESAFFKMLDSLSNIVESLTIYSHENVPENVPEDIYKDVNKQNIKVYQGRSCLIYVFQQINQKLHLKLDKSKGIIDLEEACTLLVSNSFLQIRAYEHLLIPFNKIIEQLVQMINDQSPNQKEALYFNILKSHLDPFQFALLGIDIILFNADEKVQYHKLLHKYNFFGEDNVSRLHSIPQGPAMLREVLERQSRSR